MLCVNIGHVSYALHAVVAVAAVLPGVHARKARLIVAFLLDMAKRDDARGSWQASHFRWRIRSVLWAGGLYAGDSTAMAPAHPRLDCPGSHLDLVHVPHRARLGGAERSKPMPG